MSRLVRLLLVATVSVLVLPVQALSAAPVPKGLVALDPDDNLSHALWNGTTYTELPITYAIAQAAKTKLEALCDTRVVITRDASQDYVPRAQRAGLMTNADVSLTISLNNLTGSPWGTATDGGAQSYANSNANSTALAQKSLDEWTRFTGRRNAGGVAQGGTNGTSYPYSEFAGLHGAYAQAFFGFMDHNFDWPAIDGSYDGVQYGYVIDAVVTSVGRQLQAQGITCGNSAAGQSAFPGVPSQAQLAALFALGFAAWMRYGSDPVNFATGNFLQTASLFTVPGPGGASTPVGLIYNSLDQRSGMFGLGWSSALTQRSQTFTDGSVLITSGDGSAVAYTRNPDGSYSAAQAGIYNTLTRTVTNKLVLTAPDGSAQTFTEDSYTGAGAMTARTDRAGHTWSYAYATTTSTVGGGPNPWPVAPDGSSGGSAPTPVTITSLGALTSITTPGGQKIAFTNDSAGRIATVARPDGAAWRLGYTSAGELGSISDPLGHTTRYGYDPAHRMVTVTAPDGVTYVTNSYDAQGRVIKQINGDGKTTTISYGPGTTTYTDTTGAATTFTMDGSGRVTKVVTPLGHTLSTGYTNWNTTSATDGNGNTTSYGYDSSGNLTQVTDPTGSSTSYAYTAQGDLTAQTDADGDVTRYTVDAHGQTTAIAGPDGAHWQQSFDAGGNLASRTDPNGHTTRYGYNGHGNLITVTDAAGGVTTLGYDGADRVISVTDPPGRVTKLSYDAVGDLVARVTPSGAKTSYTYQADGQVASVTDPNGHTTSYTYNNGLNLATIANPAGGVTSYGYDSEYRRTSVTDPDGHVTRYAYDAEGLLVATTDPDGHVTKRAYDAAQNLTSITAPSGAVTAISYDATNRPTSVTDAKGGVTRFAYDPAARLTSVTDPDRRTTSYGYDPAGRVVTVTDPAGHTSRYAYDPAGNQTSATDATQRTTSFAFDALNRVIAKTDPGGAKTAYGYDAASQLTTVTDPVGRVSAYSYTPDGQLAGQRDNAGAKTSYAYDPSGNITGITDPRGGTISFGYTPTNQLASRTDQDANTTGYGYDPAGQLTSQTSPLGVVTGYAHDPAGLLTAVTDNAVAGAAAGTDTNVTTRYGYNPDGQLSSVTDPNGHVTTYARDVVGRVTAVTNPLGNSTGYSYDAAGQVITKTDGDGLATGYAYSATGQIAGITPAAGMGAAASYFYDAAGRLTGMSDGTGTSSWTYNASGRMASATDGTGKTVSYGYDPSGLRTALTYPDGSKVSYTLDPVGRVATATDATGTVKYGYDPSGDLTSITRPNHTATTTSYDPAGLVTQIVHTGTTTSNDAPTSPAPTSPAPTSPAPANPTPTNPAPSGASPSSTATGTLTPASPTPTAPTPATPTASPTGTSSATVPPASPSPSASAVAGPGCGNGGVTPGCPVAALTAADGLPMTLSYVYDAGGRVTSLHQVSVSKDLTTSCGYDHLNRITSSSRTDGAKASYSYDAAGNMTAGTDTDRLTGQLLAFTATYSAADQLLTKTLAPQGSTVSKTGDTPAGTVATVNTYNKSGALIGQSVATTIAGPGNSGKTSTSTVTTSNAYNFAGQLLSSTRSDGLSTSYRYDGLGRTTDETLPDTASGSGSGSHGNGAASGKSGGPGCGNGGTTPGCPTRSPETPFAGQPVHITNDGSTPISWATASSTLDVIYGPQGPDHQTTTSTGTAATTGTSSAAWFHLDALGSIRAVTDSSGNTLAAAAYTDFGVAEPASGTLYCGTNGNSSCAPGQTREDTAGPALPLTTTCTPLGYTSQAMNPAAGLVHFAARDYQPVAASWLTADSNPGSQLVPATLNPYQFVLNNPVTLLDPDGHYPCAVSFCRSPAFLSANGLIDDTPTGPSASYLEQTRCGTFDCTPGVTTCTGECASQTPCPQYACGGNYAPPTDGAYNTGSGTAGCPDCAPVGWTSPTDPEDPASNNGRYHHDSCGWFSSLACLLAHAADAGVQAFNSATSGLSALAANLRANLGAVVEEVAGGLLVVGGALSCVGGVVTSPTGVGAVVLGSACVAGVGGGIEIMYNGASNIHGTSGSEGGGSGGMPSEGSINPGNLKDVNAARVERVTGLNPEQIKIEYLGQGDNSLFDLKRDPSSGYLVIVRKSTQKVVEITSYRMTAG